MFFKNKVILLGHHIPISTSKCAFPRCMSVLEKCGVVIEQMRYSPCVGFTESADVVIFKFHLFEGPWVDKALIINKTSPLGCYTLLGEIQNVFN